ncbi:Sporulation and spore germination [Modestobacter sp. DSM 44400]|uniref:LpqB family beta-propeller domain-containing protein n=1 Tax=Modestobacter sp. DSM 44400 TaxID=1550230 RepID=UPI0008978F9D|nr:LpqB family beta-propeller domain-containing protein [Modestobacter sp. DSM 44400]SDX48789.1 Sporulation and spore germination [Modestobacter sp. DSM 44400]
MRAVVAVLLAVLLATAVLAGCSTVPENSPTVQITQLADPPDAPVGIEPIPPEAGATPEEVVRGFIDASASTARNHPVARQFLAADAATSWSDSGGVTVIGASYSTRQTAHGTVELSAPLVGTVDERGVFTVGDGALFTRAFTLSDDSGEWQVIDPQDGLLMLQPDFVRTYDAVNAYFLDPTRTRVVPDPRYLVSGEAQPNALVERLIAGPSTAIAAGVVNALAKVQLRSTVSVAGTTARVDLTFPEGTTDAALSGLSAQVVWSLDALDLRSVEVLRDGQPLGLPGVPAIQSVDDWAALDPDAAPADAVGHYLVDGALHRATDGAPAPGPAGTGAYGLSSAAISADRRTGALGLTAGVSVAGPTASLLAGPYGGELAPVLTGGSFTAPTTAGTRSEVWTVRNGTDVVRVPASGTPQPVNAATLAGLGRTSTLQLSPDGVRAAVVVETPQGGQLYVGTVVRADDTVSVRDLRSVAPSVRQVVDVGWRNSGLLMLLAGDPSAQRTEPYTVRVDGWDLTTVTMAGLPGQPTALAATPSRQPLVTADGTLWMLSGGNWVTLLRGEQPVAGTAPFYPL